MKYGSGIFANRKSTVGKGRFSRLGRLHWFNRIRVGDFILLMLPLFILLLFTQPSKPGIETVKEGQAEEVPARDVKNNDRIIVYNVSRSEVDEYPLEEYVANVVAAEMPAKFHEEALKAQAIAARTFALSRREGLYGTYEEHFGADVCTEPKHCQAWISKERFLEVYGNQEDWEKIQKAVTDTKGMVMTYAGKLINPLYHANSGGVTEDIQEVWSVSAEVPYLKSVYSPDESTYSDFEKKTSFSWNEIMKKVKAKHPEVKFTGDPKKDLEITVYSASGRAEEIRAGSVKMPGTEFRELLSLRSTNLELSFPDKSTVEITTKGYGHGVGMSQCGADALGRKGLRCVEILEYYYTGIQVEEVEK